MSPTDAALDDLHEEQQRRGKVIRQMVDALHRKGFASPLPSERIAVYRSIPVSREDYTIFDWHAVKKFNEERGT